MQTPKITYFITSCYSNNVNNHFLEKTEENNAAQNKVASLKNKVTERKKKIKQAQI